jgi:hypothetical protein
VEQEVGGSSPPNCTSAEKFCSSFMKLLMQRGRDQRFVREASAVDADGPQATLVVEPVTCFGA